MKRSLAAPIGLALLLGCVGATPVKKNWKWVGGGSEPGEAKLIEQYSVCSGVEPGSENAIDICMNEAGWVPRRDGDS